MKFLPSNQRTYYSSYKYIFSILIFITLYSLLWILSINIKYYYAGIRIYGELNFTLIGGRKIKGANSCKIKNTINKTK